MQTTIFFTEYRHVADTKFLRIAILEPARMVA
jgi:hypothetical protein